MGTVTRLVGLVPAAALALACASPVSRVELLPAAAERPLEKIVLLPLDLPSGGRVSSARDAVGPDASEVVTGRVLEALVERTMPPQKPGEAVKLLYASQIATAPPTIAIVTNRPDAIPESYQRYLINGFRAAWGFTGAPLRLKLRRRSGRAR